MNYRKALCALAVAFAMCGSVPLAKGQSISVTIESLPGLSDIYWAEITARLTTFSLTWDIFPNWQGLDLPEPFPLVPVFAACNG